MTQQPLALEDTECPFCHKRHPKDWNHKGQCQQCHSSPVMTSKKDAIFCQPCYDKLWAATTPAPLLTETPAWLKRFSE